MSKPEELKRAAAISVSEDGEVKVIASAVGHKAEEMISKASEAGIPVRKDAEEIKKLLEEQGDRSNVPPEIYELMAAVIDFAQELNEARAAPWEYDEEIPEESEGEAEEYSEEDEEEYSEDDEEEDSDEPEEDWEDSE